MKRAQKIVLKRGVSRYRGDGRSLKPVYHWWFTVQARNGQTLATSETYTSRRRAIAGIRALVSAVVWIDAKAEAIFEDRR